VARALEVPVRVLLSLSALFIPQILDGVQLSQWEIVLNYRATNGEFMTEEAILSGCLQNDAGAQRELYMRYSPKMLSVCYRFAHNREDAEDMLQEGFIKVFSQVHTFQNKGAFEGWIRRIMVHTCINHLKKNKKFNESVDIIHANGVQVREESVPSIVQAKQIVECIRLLPLGYRTVLNLYAIEGYTHKEIADMLDVEESTSRSQYTRAKQMLEDILIKKNILQPARPKSDWLGIAAGHQ
jgi:RNA polymerase sigma-70 factor (ECF subfamily)